MTVSTSLGGPEHKPESKWSIGYKGQIAYAFLPDKEEVYSFNWKVKQPGKEIDFYFDNLHRLSKGNTKSSDIFQIKNSVSTSSSQNYIYSYFHVIEKATSNLTFDLQFSLNDFDLTKHCTVNDITFSGKIFRPTLDILDLKCRKLKKGMK